MHGRLNINGAVVLSAISLAGAFWWPYYVWWGVFLFLIPLFYSALRSPDDMGVVQGITWGIFFYLLHGYGIIQLFYEKAQGQERVIVAVAILIYCGLWAGLWFFLAQLSSRLTSLPLGRAGVWVFFTVAYFVWMEKYSWFPVGKSMGYCFASPLLPLAEHGNFLALCKVITPLGLLLLLVVGAMGVAWICYYRHKRALIVAVLCWLPFLYGWFFVTPYPVPKYVKGIYYLAPSNTIHPLDCAQEITASLQRCIDAHPDVCCIVAPESTFPFALNEHPQALEMWQENALNRSIMFIVGAHRRVGNYHYNSLWCFNGMRLTQYYDKTLLMPITESLPSFCKNSFAGKLFLNGKKQFCAGQEIKKIILNQRLRFTPRICSELYFDTAFCPADSDPIVCLVNDAWFSAAYFRQLMYLFAKYKAISWGNELLYIGHYQGVWIAPDGTTKSLV